VGRAACTQKQFGFFSSCVHTGCVSVRSRRRVWVFATAPKLSNACNKCAKVSSSARPFLGLLGHAATHWPMHVPRTRKHLFSIVFIEQPRRAWIMCCFVEHRPVLPAWWCCGEGGGSNRNMRIVPGPDQRIRVHHPPPTPHGQLSVRATLRPLAAAHFF
jgi:hypothetical protein